MMLLYIYLLQNLLGWNKLVIQYSIHYNFKNLMHLLHTMEAY